MAFQLVMAGYWVALSLWFGSAVFVMVAAKVVFEVVREEKPTLAHVLAVNLEDQHAVLLGSSIMSRLLSVVGNLQLVAAAIVIALIGVQFAVVDLRDTNLTAAIVRVGLAVVAAALLAYDRFFLARRVEKERKTYVEHADEPEVANPAKEKFDRDQQHVLMVLMAVVGLLAGLILFSSSIVPASTPAIEPTPARSN